MKNGKLKLESLTTLEALNHMELKSVSGGLQEVHTGRDDDPNSDSTRHAQDTFKNIDGGDISLTTIRV